MITIKQTRMTVWIFCILDLMLLPYTELANTFETNIFMS